MRARFMRSWALTTLAFLALLMVPVAVNLFLASGYGYEAFHLWRPPNEAGFRSAMGLVALGSVARSAVCSTLGLIRGPRWPRILATLPLLGCLGLLAILLYSAVA